MDMIRIFVDKNGCDSANGSASAPFATIERARDEVRALIAQGLTAPVTVTINAGEYITDGICFGAEDSGTEEYPIVYEANGEVLINGAFRLLPEVFVPLNDEEKSRLHGEAREKVLKVDLGALGLTRADYGEMGTIGAYTTEHMYDDGGYLPRWCELFVDDVRMTVARYPDSGFLFTGEVIREGDCLWPNGESYKDEEVWMKIRNPLGDICKLERDVIDRMKTWKTTDGAWIYGYPRFGWADASTPFNVNYEEGSIETKYVSQFGMKEKAPYYLYNVFEEMDAPGEWYLDRDRGILYLYPTKCLENSRIYLTLTTNCLFTLEHVTDMTIRGITFAGTRGNAIRILGKRITLDGCTIKNVAGWGARIDATNCTVKNCEILRTGEGGISLCGGDRNHLVSSGNLITNNHIHHIAEIVCTYRPGIDIFGVNCVVSHNLIHDSSHQAITFRGNDHVIEYNEIHDVCKVTDDSSAIYSGRDYTTAGNIICYNYFHDMKSDADTHIGIFGVYCDDNLGATEIIGNVFLRCQSAVLMHGGHDMNFSNNLIIDFCPKSEYSIRFHDYEYWRDLLPGGDHGIYLNEVPWQNEIWTEKYPHTAEYLTWDPQTEQAFPHYGIMKNNVIINHKPIDIRFDHTRPELKNTVCDNLEIASREAVGIPEGDTLDLSQNCIRRFIPEFEQIPLEKIGLLKN